MTSSSSSSSSHRLRAGLCHGQPQCPGALGGPVWGLPQHRPVHYRPVHLSRAGQVGEAERHRPAASPRHGGHGEDLGTPRCWARGCALWHPVQLPAFMVAGARQRGLSCSCRLLHPQGPEHSSARPERFLQMCNDDPDVFPVSGSHAELSPALLLVPAGALAVPWICPNTRGREQPPGGLREAFWLGVPAPPLAALGRGAALGAKACSHAASVPAASPKVL